MVGLVVCGGVVAGCWGEGFFCGGWGGVFGMHLFPFWYELVVIGGVFGFLSLWGGLFGFRCMTPPPPCSVGGCWVWGWFFSELPVFFLGIGSGWSVFWVAFFVGRLFQVPMCDPPSMFFPCGG